MSIENIKDLRCQYDYNDQFFLHWTSFEIKLHYGGGTIGIQGLRLIRAIHIARIHKFVLFMTSLVQPPVELVIRESLFFPNLSPV